MREHDYYVYILTNKKNGTLYVGVTNCLSRRVAEHRNHTHDGFTSKYGIHMLVYYEHFADITVAIRREKQIKSWSRKKKVALIERRNLYWEEIF
jgi:putative endonuclease